MEFSVLSTAQGHLRTKREREERDREKRVRERKRERERRERELVSWCFEPTQPQRITSELERKREGGGERDERVRERRETERERSHFSDQRKKTNRPFVQR